MNLEIVIAGLLAAVVLLAISTIYFAFRKTNNSALTEMADNMYRAQTELAGRLSMMNENNIRQQNQLATAINEQKLSMLKMVDEKLLEVTKNVGQGLQQSTEKTNQTLHDLRERLAKIDVAQQKISTLSEQVVSLQEVLTNKQARGAFGEIQLNDLVSSILPPSAYAFQVVLSNQKRADCVLKLPNPPGTIVIDSKFPLESYQALRKASNEREKLEAERFFKASVLKHIKDISEKYIIPGETAESALMFMSSESVYAELHANFVDVVEASYRAKVWIVSPTTLMATLNTVRAVLKDARMQEQAGVIQKEVGMLIEDIDRIDERIENLSKHFDMASKDIGEIKVSSGKISKRIEKIEDIELGPQEKPLAVEHLTGHRQAS